ncbi:MAG: ATP-binding protein [Deltaproteobacteria bacterium]
MKRVDLGEGLTYPHWEEDQKGILRSLTDKRVFLLFSGGKDSSLALDFMLRASREFGFAFEAHAGAYPVHRYDEAARKEIDAYWNGRGMGIIWHELGETDEQIEKSVNPCVECQKMRRKVLQAVLAERVDDWERLVIVVSYSLWDLVSYAVEHLLGDLFTHLEKGIGPGGRFRETAQRFYPLLTMKEGYSVYRPLIKCNGQDILDMVRQTGIPVLSTPCRFKGFRPKRILESYYEKMGLRFEYGALFDFARKSLSLPDPGSYTSICKEEYLLRVF